MTAQRIAEIRDLAAELKEDADHDIENYRAIYWALMDLLAEVESKPS